MIDGLIMGRVHARAEKRTSKSGKPFATIKIRAGGGDGESVFINAICFDEAPINALMVLNIGDSVAIAGELTLKAWIDKEGNARPALDVVAQQVLTAYHVRRKHNMGQPTPEQQ